MRVLIVSFIVLFASTAFAGVPAKMPVQGYLTDANNNPVDSTVNVQFQLYSTATGGTPLYTESQAVTVEDGNLTVYLGSNVPLDMKLFRGGAAYLGITLPNEAEMTPRLELATVPFAAYAQETAAVPPGAVMMFDLDTCPVGWSALDTARGRAIVGTPTGGTRGGTVGTALANQENRMHTHAVDPDACTTTTAGAHTHNVNPAAFSHTHQVHSGDLTVTGGTHNHAWASWNGATKIWSTWASDGVTQVQAVDFNNGVDGAGSTGDFPFELANHAVSANAYTVDSSHSHVIPETTTSSTAIDVPDTLSTTSGAHNHSCDAPAAPSGAATTGDAMPYLQLLICRKD